MVSMEIQNLRVYERRGLVQPDRTPGGSRLYSPDDIRRLHRIHELRAEGLNLAGIARVLPLEARIRQREGRLRREARADPRGCAIPDRVKSGGAGTSGRKARRR